MFRINTFNYFVILLFSLILSCRKEEFPTRDYPRIEMISVEQSGSGVLFKAEIITDGISEINEKGFVWSKTGFPTINSSKINASGPNTKGTFEQIARCDFLEHVYTVCAYVKTDDYIVYSKGIEFGCTFISPPPIITDFEPKKGRWGDSLRIKGQFFSYIPKDVQVYLNRTVSKVISTNDTIITAIISGEGYCDSTIISVGIRYKGTGSKEYFQYLNPIVQDFNPKEGKIGDIITITGYNFPDYIEYCDVTFAYKKAQIVEVSQKFLKVKVPSGLSHYSTMIVEIAGVRKVFAEHFTLTPY